MVHFTSIPCDGVFREQFVHTATTIVHSDSLNAMGTLRKSNAISIGSNQLCLHIIKEIFTMSVAIRIYQRKSAYYQALPESKET